LSYEITNTGKREIAIPGDQFGNIISVSYGWEAVSESAKQTKAIPGAWHYGNAISANGALSFSIRKSSLAPGESVAIHDVARPSSLLLPEDTGCMFSSSAAMPPTRASRCGIWSRRSR
jgi:hypothetical protein